jgi:hypothetical protein
MADVCPKALTAPAATITGLVTGNSGRNTTGPCCSDFTHLTSSAHVRPLSR